MYRMDDVSSLIRNNIPENKETLKRKILVAEDHVMQRIALVGMLQVQGYEVDEVENGQLLVETLLKGDKKYDLVITDNEMPKLNGVDALEIIRADSRFDDLPVIVHSSETNETEMAKRIKELKAVGIVKGDTSFLVKEIKKILEPNQEQSI